MRFYNPINYMKVFDIFAKPIENNINKKGNAHKTAFGGCVSAILRLIYLGYFIFLLQKLVYYQEDQTFSYQNEI